MSTNHTPPIAGQPADREGLVFNAPWEAKSFSMAVHLYERGVFSWREWADTLAVEISLFESCGGSVEGDRYYRLWQQALEKLVSRKLQDCQYSESNKSTIPEPPK